MFAFCACGSSFTSVVGWRNAENMRHHALSLCDYRRKPEHPWGAGSARGQFPGRGVLHDLRDGLRHQLHEHSSTCRQGLWFSFFLPLTHSNPNASHGEPKCKFLFVCLFVFHSSIVINLINPRLCPFFTYGLNEWICSHTDSAANKSRLSPLSKAIIKHYSSQEDEVRAYLLSNT